MCLVFILRKKDDLMCQVLEKMKIQLLFLIILICFEQILAENYYGLLYGRPKGSQDWSVEVCLTYNPDFYSLPTTKDSAILGQLEDLTPDFGCYDSNVYNGGIGQGNIVAVARGNCTFVEKTVMAQKHGTTGVIIVSDTQVNPGLNQTSDKGRFNISSVVVLLSNFYKIKELGNNTELLIYAPSLRDGFDPCLVVIFLLALFCIAVGGYWSGLVTIDRIKQKQEKEQRKKAKRTDYTQSSEEGRKEKEEEEDKDEDENLDITIPAVLIFFVLVCGFLVLLYFFYDYLVYVIISMFCIAGSIGLFYCIAPLWKYIPISLRCPKLPCSKSQPEIKYIVLYCLCATVAIVWAIQRHESYAWVLQDILGVAFCINMLKTIQVPNLKICSILLVLLFVYDIFFVFITPYFTKSGESIMVKVATGGSSKSSEKLPMVFIVPRLTSPYNSCLNQPSMLGFGDVIVPGLLIGYNHGIDLRVDSRKMYYIATVIGYAVGMVITFVALEVMQTGQPALLYLVPCTLITTFVIGYIRGEVKLLWNGVQKLHIKSENDGSPQSNSQPKNTDPDTTSINQVSIDVNGGSTTIDSENKSLIRK